MVELRKSYKSIQEYLRDNLEHYQAKDLVLVRRLQKSSKLSDEYLMELLTWWSSEKQLKTSFLEFLVKAGVLSENAKKVLAS